MLNQDRYKTPEERALAFCDYCSGYRDCENYDDCPLSRKVGSECHFQWLALEAEEEEPSPEPCPFCGSTVYYNNDFGTMWCSNEDCHYASGTAGSKADAIAAHNRVARAVKAAKEKEAHHA